MKFCYAKRFTAIIIAIPVMIIFLNGCSEEDPGTVGTPDLIVRSIVTEGEANIGQTTRYIVIVENIDAGTAKNFIVKLYSGIGAEDLSNNIDQYIVPELRPGEIHTRTRSLSFVPTSYSTGYIIAVVDPDDRIPEAREDNNMDSIRIQFYYDEREGMAFIPAGEFEMGDHHGDGGSDERPVHTVYVDGFYMDKYEVTNAQYARFLNDYGKNTDDSGKTLLYIDDCRINKSGGIYVPDSGYEDHPVVEVTWYGAMAYARFYNKRLPTEAEWEYAARGGLEGKKYPWGNEISHQDANYDGTGGRDVWNGTAPVGSFPPNGYGLYDMAGNVWEWCADWYDSGYYRISPERNPTGPNSGSYRVLRGGGWDSSPSSLRVAFRNSYNPASTSRRSGFRCVSQD
ncbi:SUMF1/EgtB/PvdO family nonheme iron enzyme [Candidatus Poribacteria bacterium]|nr:SUMF1/EgtB/PvdO family nonheme iron enzyme [Candidatus Poribacteria bacterium]